ncbi:MAG: hypothetical protein C4542_07445 [Dehalococcoidia bacterium]|nr:MAG: hypothetical protein C4542_07445 [Dehalococcoidia bacterium]
MGKLKLVATQFPKDWPHFCKTVLKDLDVEPGELADFLDPAVRVDLPVAVLADLRTVAEQLGPEWTLGRVISYLALRGAMTVTAQGEQASTS